MALTSADILHDLVEEPPVTTVTRAVGAVLIALGVLGALASREALHRHMIYAALVVALLGLIGSIPA